jgi:hypothetical protein
MSGLSPQLVPFGYESHPIIDGRQCLFRTDATTPGCCGFCEALPTPPVVFKLPRPSQTPTPKTPASFAAVFRRWPAASGFALAR